MLEKAIEMHAAAIEAHAEALEKLAAAIAQQSEHTAEALTALRQVTAPKAEPQPEQPSTATEGKPEVKKPVTKSEAPAETPREKPTAEPLAEQAEKPADEPAETPVESGKTPADEHKTEQVAEPTAPTFALPESLTLADARKIIRKGLTEALKFAAANSQKRLEQLKNFCIEHGAKNPDLIPDDKVAEVWCRLRDEIKIKLEA